MKSHLRRIVFFILRTEQVHAASRRLPIEPSSASAGNRNFFRIDIQIFVKAGQDNRCCFFQNSGSCSLLAQLLRYTLMQFAFLRIGDNNLHTGIVNQLILCRCLLKRPGINPLCQCFLVCTPIEQPLIILPNIIRIMNKKDGDISCTVTAALL